MAEKLQRAKQYQYRENANLVLNPVRENPIPRDDATGAVESLWGKLKGTKFGDRALARERDKELEDKIQKMRKRAVEKQKIASADEQKKQKNNANNKTSVLGAVMDSYGGYKPKTKDTRDAYDSLLNFVANALGDQPQDIVKGASDEVLATLKTQGMKAPEKKNQIEKLLLPISEQQFAELTSLAVKITDYSDSSNDNNNNGGPLTGVDNAIDEEFGVAVVFDEEDQEDEKDEKFEVDERSESDDDNQIIDEQQQQQQQQQQDLKRSQDDVEMSEGGDEKGLSSKLGTTTRGGGLVGAADKDKTAVDPREISRTAFWLKAKVAQFVDADAENSRKLSEQILSILEEKDDRVCENKLVQLLNFEKFDFIKMLLKNRLKIVWCTRLAHAPNDAERSRIEQDMRKDPLLNQIVEQLHRTAATTTTAASPAQQKGKSSQVSASKNNNNLPTTRGRHLIDLENVKFSAGGHVMTNKQTVLPPNSYRKQNKDYEEIHIPALKAPPIEDTEKIISISSMPEWSHKAFAGIKELNRVQSKLYPVAFETHENFLLCAPTGAGKTNVAMLAIMHEIGLNLKENGELDLDNFKIVYVAPMKSLVQEVVGSFTKRLTQAYGIQVRELTGDSNLSKQQIKETQLIVTTPEKWDIITRKSGDRSFTQQVRLIIIDEIHLLHDDRGPVLESLVARTLRHVESTQEMIRLIGLSATLPNYEDVGTFLRVKPDAVFRFDNAYRPCPLEQQYIGITEKKAIKRYQLINEITYDKVLIQVKARNQVLVFVHSRKETAKTAKALRDLALQRDELTRFVEEGSASREILRSEAEETVKNPELKDLLPFGFGIHHAGLNRTDRTLVEELFHDGHIQVLISTATLAWGVNLPAHSVIIKGTQVYSPEKGRWIELSPMDAMQMLGRAGRPAYDTYGEGIVITNHDQLQFYLSLMNQQLPIESQMISKLADNLNAEIVLGTIQNLEEAANWLGYTYLYICMLRNPSLYGISADEAEADPLLKQRRLDLVHTAATLLDKANLIKYDRKSGQFLITDLGIVASHYYVTYQSMQVYNDNLKPNMSEIDIFRVFSLSSEFKYISVREEEKIELEKLLDKVPIPIKESMEESTAKVNVLLQAYVSRLKLEGFALMADMVYVTQSASRLFRALYEIALKRGWAQLTNRLLRISKMVDRRMWSIQTPLRQFARDIPEDVIKKIERKDFPLERMYDLNAMEIGELIAYPAMGKTVFKLVHQFPKLDVTAHVQPITRSTLKVHLTITPDFEYDEKYHEQGVPFWIFIEDVDGEKILHYEYFLLKQKYAEEEQYVDFMVPLLDPLPPHYFIRVVSDRWLGPETIVPLPFQKLLLPERFPPPTELLDLQPLLVSELKNARFEKFYPFKTFNPIQTQVFGSLYQADQNVLVCASTNSGKTVCAEFAIFRLFSKNPRGKVLYVGPTAGLCQERFADWQRKFEVVAAGGNNNTSPWSVVQLTGDVPSDLKLLERASIIISTPEQWDVLSRRWKQRKNVQAIDLFIADELHLLGGEQGPVIEVVVSRMRYLFSHLKKGRIVGLASSIANARDIGDWIGATAQTTFNFHPNTRPIPLEVHIQGFDQTNYDVQTLSMIRPTLYAVSQHARTKPTMIFVPSKKLCRTLARDFVAFADPEERERTFLHCNLKDIERHLEHIQNKLLKETLAYGVAFYHDGLTREEKKIVEELFKAGAVQILIVDHAMAWGLTLSAYQVIIMGAKSYNGKEHRYVDYPIADILQMIGRAGRPTQDDSAKCFLFCWGPRKEFYKRFLFEPIPVESHLDHSLSDNINAEIVTKTIETVQDAVDWITWTFLYRRLIQNPAYYHLSGVTQRHLSDYLSELVESTLQELQKAKCVMVVDEELVKPLNLGMIACYYNVHYATIDLFNSSLSASSKIKSILEVLSNAIEFDSLPIRHGESNLLKKIATHERLKIPKPNYTSVPTKVHLLLQSHFSRTPLPGDLLKDQEFIVEHSVRLLQALVDVVASNGWLQPALSAMELSQMLTQAMWDNDSLLRQLPHMDGERVARAERQKVKDIFALLELEDEDRNDLLRMSDRELADVARVCNRYPNVELSYKIEERMPITAGTPVHLNVSLDRDFEGELGFVTAPYFSKPKSENWWLVVCEKRTNQLISIKRTTIGKDQQVQLEFNAPESIGKQTYNLYLMCDSYVGVDQEHEVSFSVGSGSDAMRD